MWTASDFESATERLLSALAGRPLIIFGMDHKIHEQDNDDNCHKNMDDDMLLHLQWQCRRGENGNSYQLVTDPPVRIARHAECKSHILSDDNDDNGWIDETIEVDDDAISLENDRYLQKTYNEWKFSIVFSDTWQTPVLYFTVHDGQGILLSRPEILRLLPLPVQSQRSNSEHHSSWVDDLTFYDFVSADEHPISGVPSYFLHPCRVNSLLRTMMNEKEEHRPEIRLLSWMALMLPNAGMRIPPDTYLHLHAKLITRCHTPGAE
jgi:hypothetical protein